MASFLDRFKNLVSKSAQKTHIDFNRAIYNYLGDTLVWNPENDDTYIDKGYRYNACLLYTSPSPRDGLLSRMPSSA